MYLNEIAALYKTKDMNITSHIRNPKDINSGHGKYTKDYFYSLYVISIAPTMKIVVDIHFEFSNG